MFEQSLMDLASTDRKRPWTVGLSLLIQATILGVLILIPLIFTESLSGGKMMTFLAAPPPPPPPPPPAPAAPVHVVKMVREFEDGRLTAPKEIPKEIQMIKEEEMPPPSSGVGVPGGVPGGTPGGSMGGVIGGIVSAAPTAAPPPPPPPKVEVPHRINVGGNVQAARAISRPNPVYPQLARQARIQGVVKLEAVIDETGKITDLKVISGHPLLVQAALDAVKQWRYQPTVLNNVAVQVATTIDVNFTLSQ